MAKPQPGPKGKKPAGPPSPPPPAGQAGAGAGAGKPKTATRYHCVVCKKQGISRFADSTGKCQQHGGSKSGGGWPWLRALLLALLALLLALLLSRCPVGPLVPPVPASQPTAAPPVTPGGKVGKPVATAPVVVCPTTLRVAAFFDKNGNGAKDNGEPLLSGFQFRIVETGTVGTTNSGGADAMEATPGRKYTVVITGQPGPWMASAPSQEVAAPPCQDKTVYFPSSAAVIVTPSPTPRETPSPTVKPTEKPDRETRERQTPVPTATPKPTPRPAPVLSPSPSPVKTPDPTKDYDCRCTPPSSPVPTPSPYPSGKPTPSPVFP
ncbi:hypothetical protein A2797_02615 [candidate division WWE3 bacterium RIFCSPHIGHO2_01_FULL_48_15]|uniref:SD-repeat containing protein B domain-containing protein n=1 Tax=candidate division WWE3 bacterium RIFCSPHIGHO2_01_FULL_48_15 TaxID=1802619 RepID=A0A1F4VA89_UNCKA|nr:MAG: hypothetical protein A2797_02615 [candidate division WWE3 bacterium RIFCSPHIGHO2_01_FULL_48_15]